MTHVTEEYFWSLINQKYRVNATKSRVYPECALLMLRMTFRYLGVPIPHTTMIGGKMVTGVGSVLLR